MTHEELRRIQRTAIERAMASVDETMNRQRSRYMTGAEAALIDETHQAVIEDLFMLKGEYQVPPPDPVLVRPEVRVSGR